MRTIVIIRETNKYYRVMKRDKELKQAVIKWLFENDKAFNRLQCCMDAFKAYIYDGNGNYLIGGREVAEFIGSADKLLFD